MSATSIEYFNRTIAIQEQFLEVISNVLCETMDSISDSSDVSLLTDLYQTCNSIRKGSFSGWALLVLHDDLESEIQKQAFHNVCTDAMSYLSTFGNELPITYLNQMEADKFHENARWNWPKPIKTSNMVAVMFLLQELVEGTISFDNYILNFTGWQKDPFGYNLP